MILELLLKRIQQLIIPFGGTHTNLRRSWRGRRSRLRLRLSLGTLRPLILTHGRRLRTIPLRGRLRPQHIINRSTHTKTNGRQHRELHKLPAPLPASKLRIHLPLRLPSRLLQSLPLLPSLFLPQLGQLRKLLRSLLHGPLNIDVLPGGLNTVEGFFRQRIKPLLGLVDKLMHISLIRGLNQGLIRLLRLTVTVTGVAAIGAPGHAGSSSEGRKIHDDSLEDLRRYFYQA